MQVKALRMLGVSTLIGAGLFWGGRMLTSSDVAGGHELEAAAAVHFAAAYALSLLSFAACPRTRRGDLSRLCFLAGALLCLMRAAVWREDMTQAMVGDALGVLAAALPTTLERLRKALRADPESRVSMRHPQERRSAPRRRRDPVFS